MRNEIPNKEELVAPCGMNCAICSRYLAYVNNLNKSQCAGCHASNYMCSYLFGKCTGINSALEGEATAKFCFECDQYPCREINRMDKRYRNNYKMSVIENLEAIKKNGIMQFIDDQYKAYNCPKCGELISIHNKKCFKCHKITKLIDKTAT